MDMTNDNEEIGSWNLNKTSYLSTIIFVFISNLNLQIYAQDTLELKFIDIAQTLENYLKSEGDLINGDVEGYWMGNGHFLYAKGNTFSFKGRFRLKYEMVFKITLTEWLRVNVEIQKRGSDFILQIEDINMDKFPGEIEQRFKNDLNADLKNQPLDLSFLPESISLGKIEFFKINDKSLGLRLLSQNHVGE